MNDDMFNPTNQTFLFYRALPLLDWVFTTKSYNVPEFLEAGAKNAVYVPNAYDATIHYPARPLPDELPRYRGDVAFIGTFRRDRADYLAGLCARLDSTCVVRVWGGGWHKMGRVVYWLRRRAWEPLNKGTECRELWGPEMGKAIQANKICLGLLNHANRDLHTSRTFEIPACGGFMLAERTCEQLGFFEEDKEAAYFSTIEELVDKLRFYMRADSVRERISRTGYERCLRSGYQYTDRAKTAISFLRPNLR
jgi:spore maturation protein CgeB